MAGQDRIQDAYRRADRTWKAANADGAAVLDRLLIAERAAATGRFEGFWPTPSPSRVMPPTRRLLRDWYLRVVENHLARGIMAPADSPIDGSEAERVMAAVPERTGADSPIVVDAVIELARDARHLADLVAHARKDYVDAALRGRVGKLFQRSTQTPVGMRQALAEQWYVRGFRAAIEPALYRLQTPPVTTAEIQAVGISLSEAVPRILYLEGHPIGPATPDGWLAHTAKQWTDLTMEERAGWLTQRSWGADFAEADFAGLPITVQSQLLQHHRPSEVIMAQGVATGAPDQAAAEAFGAAPIRTPTATDLELASVLFSRVGVTLPSQLLAGLSDTNAIESALDALHANNMRRGEMRGHIQHQTYWADDHQRDRAVELRMAGKSFQAIGNELGISDHQVARGLREGSTIPAEFVRKDERPGWTEERVRAAAYLRSQGHTYTQIAAVFGYREGQTVRHALTKYGPDLRIDPITGRTIPTGEPMPDPHRWAPRRNPWDGAERTSEDPAVVAERLKRERTLAPSSSSVKHQDQNDIIARMIKRQDAIGGRDPDPAESRDLHGSRAEAAHSRYLR